MKTFLETWLSRAPLVFAQELSSLLQLTPTDQPPAPDGAMSVAMNVSGAASGRFLILADRSELHALLVAVNVAEDGTDQQWEAELFRGLLDQIAQDVGATIGGLTVAPAEPIEWPAGIPAATYKLGLGGGPAMLIAFVDQTRPFLSPLSSNAAADRSAAPGGTRRGVDLLLDVELEASLRFGSREMSLNEVLDLGPGDVVELDRHITEPVDLLVGDKIVARGEVVLVNGNFGFSVLEVATPEMRLESIRCLF
jgi:flagellar motor switch protein FliN/FliY